MLGYDWPRLHAALNDLPAALLLVAVLFELAGARHPPARPPGGRVLDPHRRRGRRRAGGALRDCRPRSTSPTARRSTGSWRPTSELALITLGIFAVVALWRIVREKRMGGTERGAVLALVARRDWACCSRRRSYGGKLVFDHAAGIPTAVLRGRDARAGRGSPPPRRGGRGRGGPDARSRRRRPAAGGRRAAADSADSAEPAGATPMRPARRRTRTDRMRCRWAAMAAGDRGAVGARAGRRPLGRRSRPCRSRPRPRSGSRRARPPDCWPTRCGPTRSRPARVELRDAWLETSWFEAATGRPSRHRPIGRGPGAGARLGRADPSRATARSSSRRSIGRWPIRRCPERELDRQVPRDHPVAIKVRAALQELVKRYGGPPAPAARRGRPAPSRPRGPSRKGRPNPKGHRRPTRLLRPGS